MIKALSSFCHINDYREQGFINLHRMIYCSRPLVLWAPSGILLENYNKKETCKVSIRDFIEFVEKGKIKVIARESFLNRKHRNEHPFEGYHWHNVLDDALLQIHKNDEIETLENRRVKIVEKEDGYEWADKILEKEPKEVNKIWKLINKKKIPLGSLDKALRKDNKVESVREVLRDVRNHSRAFELSNTDVPILSKQDGDFFRLLEKGDFDDKKENIKEEREEKVINTSQLENCVMSLLKRLDEYSRAKSYKDFIYNEEGHREFCEFLFAIYRNLNTIDIKEVSSHLINNIIIEIEKGIKQKEDITIRELLSFPRDKLLASLEIGGIITNVAGIIVDPLGILNLIGITLISIPLFTGVLKRVGWIPLPYEGTRWPFLYVFGNDRPKPNQIEYINKILNEYKTLLN